MDCKTSFPIGELKNMLTRLQVNSKTASVDVYKSLPSAERNTRYALTVERFTIPPMAHGFLNKPLFTVERRLSHGADITDPEEIASKTLTYPMTFTPKNVQTVGQFAYQMNEFFRKGITLNVKRGIYRL